MTQVSVSKRHALHGDERRVDSVRVAVFDVEANAAARGIEAFNRGSQQPSKSIVGSGLIDFALEMCSFFVVPRLDAERMTGDSEWR
jgi:hypothetical protein